MKCGYRACVILFLLTMYSPLGTYAQQQAYFPHRVIIKYESDSRLRTIRSKNNIDPIDHVRQVLQQVGATRTEPIWKFGTNMVNGHFRSANLEPNILELQRIYEVSYSSNTNAAALAAELSKMPGVEYAEPKYIRRMQFLPDDPVVNPYRDYHRFTEAWDITKGSPDVVIAVVDGGVNYLHADLKNKLWVNTDEVNPGVRSQIDDNGDGTITSTEVLDYLTRNDGDYNDDGSITLKDALAQGSPLLTGSDTDGNDFTDDIFGWDFWQSGGINGQPVTQDNDPVSDGTDHGAHVAGIAAAETNNNFGIAGTGFNSRYMAVKTGGIPDDPSTEDDESETIGFGYEGIIYAALQGANVINCSWGGGGYSKFENDVIDFAAEAGALVVAAAGNEALNSVDYPAAYEKVLAVGSIESTDKIASYSNIGYDVDVFATGSGIQSTGFDNKIVTKSGTSMATPVVAGLAALVKSVHPGWAPLRVGTQIRSSSAFLSGRNDRQGHGKVDAMQAVSTDLPGVRVLSATFTDTNGHKLGLGETGTMQLEIVNYGKAVSNLLLQATSESAQGITINQSQKSVGALATGAQTTVNYQITISENYDLNIVPVFRINMDASQQDYEDFDIVQYQNILFNVVDANNIKTSFGGDGTVGFTDAFAEQGGVGFIPKLPGENDFNDQNNMLYEGGLMIEADGQIFDAVRGENNHLNKDFEPLETFSVDEDGTVSAQDGQTTFHFEDGTGQTSGRVQLDTYAFTDPSLSNVVYLKYSITNSSSTAPMQDMYVGLFNDWDIGDNPGNNDINYSSADSILYISSGDASSDLPLVAVAHLGTISSVLAIENFPDTPPVNPTIDLGDGFSDAEKSAALKAGKVRTHIQSADVSAVTASGPYTLNPNSTLTVGFVYAFGADLDKLRSQIKAARAQSPFAVSPTGTVISDYIPPSTKLLQNTPNPFRDHTTIRLDLQKASHVTLTLYNVLGQKVYVIRDEQMEASEHFISFTPTNLSSGIYYLRLETEEKTQTVPITYIK